MTMTKAYIRLKRSLPYIQSLLKVKENRDRTLLFKKFPDFVANDIVEVLYNILLKNCNISCKHKHVLMKNKCHLASLVHTTMKKRGRRNKAKYLKNVMYKQKGGFLGSILPIISTVLGGLVRSA